MQAITKIQFRKIIEALLQQNNKNGYYAFTRIRNVIMFSLQYYLGLRPREVYASKISYLDINNNQFFVPSSSNKQRYEDIMPIPDFLIIQLKNYLNYRKIFYPDSIWLFPARKGMMMNRSHYSKIFRQALKLANLYMINYTDKQGLNRSLFNPYSLRASFGTRVFEETGNLKKTSIALRHRDIMMRTTWKYVQINESFMRKKILNEVYKNL